MKINEFRQQFENKEIAKGSLLENGPVVSIAGRIHNIRAAGTKLHFYDIRGDGAKIQVLYN